MTHQERAIQSIGKTFIIVQNGLRYKITSHAGMRYVCCGLLNAENELVSDEREVISISEIDGKYYKFEEPETSVSKN